MYAHSLPYVSYAIFRCRNRCIFLFDTKGGWFLLFEGAMNAIQAKESGVSKASLSKYVSRGRIGQLRKSFLPSFGLFLLEWEEHDLEVVLPCPCLSFVLGSGSCMLWDSLPVWTQPRFHLVNPF